MKSVLKAAGILILAVEIAFFASYLVKEFAMIIGNESFATYASLGTYAIALLIGVYKIDKLKVE